MAKRGQPSELVSATRVDVCLCTIGRTSALATLMEALGRQVLPVGNHVDLAVVVVDNTCAGTALQSVPIPDGLELRWAHEPQPGIPVARNTSLERVRESADFVVFIDDDEIPSPDWIAALLSCQERYSADIVTGPVRPRFVEPPPRWAVRGGFYDRASHPTGARLPIAYTNNTLVRAEVVRSLGRRPFNERMSLTGGSDAELFERLVKRGATVYWAADAVVEEWVPPSRVSVRWILQRVFRYGVNHGQLDRRPGPGQYRKTIARLAKGLGHFTLGFLGMPLRLREGYAGLIKGLRQSAFGAGNLAGLAGYRYEEYRTRPTWPRYLPDAA